LLALATLYHDDPKLGMKKWITSNYHYMVPEFDESTEIKPDFKRFLEDCRRGAATLGKDCATPVILGPVSLVRLTNISLEADVTKKSLLSSLLAIYKELLEQVASLGVTEIQIHEPALVFDEANQLNELFELAYPAILPSNGPAINLVSYMDDVGEEHYKWLVSEDNGLSIISLDFPTAKSLVLG
jgi:5-methyltetrahydropteroyltriglutamate--homocysteine methyltransferase